MWYKGEQNCIFIIICLYSERFICFVVSEATSRSIIQTYDYIHDNYVDTFEKVKKHIQNFQPSFKKVMYIIKNVLKLNLVKSCLKCAWEAKKLRGEMISAEMKLFEVLYLRKYVLGKCKIFKNRLFQFVWINYWQIWEPKLRFCE